MIRTPEAFEARLDLVLTDESLVHLFEHDRFVNRVEEPQVFSWAELKFYGFEAAQVISLGSLGAEQHVAVRLADGYKSEALPQGWRSAGLRTWFGAIDQTALALSMRAVQLLEWDRTHRFCGSCGTATTLQAGERAKRCPSCELTVYPRISPAMMVLVTKGEQLLLARGVNFPPGRFSALAGFLEAGESIEDCIIREVREEVGIEVDGLEYFGSQSWPFPNSLMIAFTAKWVSGEITPDLSEIAEAAWYSPEALPQLPPRLSISRALIDGTIAKLRY